MRKSTLALAGITAALATMAPMTSASAAVAPVKPFTVIMDGSTVAVKIPVTTTHRKATVGLWAGEGLIAWGQTNSRGQGVVSGRATSKLLKLGVQRWELEDGSNDPVTGVSVTVLRRTRVSAPMTKKICSGQYYVSGIVSHYDPRINGYAGDQKSPVQIQILKNGAWSTVRTATTAMDGSFTITLSAPDGSMVRFNRPVGITGGVSGGSGVPLRIR